MRDLTNLRRFNTTTMYSIEPDSELVHLDSDLSNLTHLVSTLLQLAVN